MISHKVGHGVGFEVCSGVGHWVNQSFFATLFKILVSSLCHVNYRVFFSLGLPLKSYKMVEQVPSEIRPVGIKASLIRVLHRRVVQANKGALREYLEPCQVALMPGGAAVLSNTVRMMLEQNPNFVCVFLDVQNAHNAMARAAVVKRLEAVPGLRHLAQHAATCLAAHHAVESGGEKITCGGRARLVSRR